MIKRNNNISLVFAPQFYYRYKLSLTICQIFFYAQVMSFQYLLSCTPVPGFYINSNLVSPSLSLPLCCFILVYILSFTWREKIKIIPAQRQCLRHQAEGHLNRRTCPSVSSCRKKWSLEFIFFFSSAHCKSGCRVKPKPLGADCCCGN